jgi:tellurite resistance protein
MAEVVLDEFEVVALIGQREAARMVQRVRMHTRQASTFGRDGDQVAGERLAAFGDEQPGQRVATGGA